MDFSLSLQEPALVHTTLFIRLPHLVTIGDEAGENGAAGVRGSGTKTECQALRQAGRVAH